MADHLDARIIAVINAARFAVWRRDMDMAMAMFTKAEVLMRQAHGVPSRNYVGDQEASPHRPHLRRDRRSHGAVRPSPAPRIGAVAPEARPGRHGKV